MKTVRVVAFVVGGWLLGGCADEAPSDARSAADAGEERLGSSDEDAAAIRDAGLAQGDAASRSDAALDAGGTPLVHAPSDASVWGRTADAQADAQTGQDAGGSDADAQVASTDLCRLKGHQVGVMGDSYIDLSGDFTRYLQDRARQAGALGATEVYIDKSRSGAAMQSSTWLAPAIPMQLPTVLTDSKRVGAEGVKLVVMTGGGNDVLIGAPQCKALTTPTDDCKAVVAKTLVVMKSLFADMAKAGIKEVIYFWYPDLGMANGKVINDYSIPLAREACTANPSVRCRFVDTRAAFEGHSDYIGPDGTHPSAKGSRAISDLVWNVMVENCVGAK